MNSYECLACKRSNIKLWRPYGDSSPLVCASCAEAHQSPFEYDEMKYIKVSNNQYVGKPTGRKIQGERWTVDNLGRVPSYLGPGPNKLNIPMTDQLIVDISDIDKSCSSGKTTMIPAVPIDDGIFSSYGAVPQDMVEWWETLPTR